MCIRDSVEAAANEGNHQAAAALDAFYYRVAKYIGAYTAAMNGVDAAVSYTHLDVYKRQPVTIPDGIQALYLTYRGNGNAALRSFELS